MGTDLSGSVEVILYCILLSKAWYSNNEVAPDIMRTDCPPADVHVNHSRSPERVARARDSRLQFSLATLVILA